jgi:predicted O-methyltransferase YrrM
LSNRTLSIDDRVYDYLLSVSLEESELLRELRAETASIEFAEVQIAPEQGQRVFRSLVPIGDGLTLVYKSC